jgi:hypothetical protein
MSDTTSADVGTDSITPIISVRPVTLAASHRASGPLGRTDSK